MSEEEKIISEIMDLVTQLGWNIIIPESEDGEAVNGLIIGNDDFISQYSSGADDESLH